jgi:hypothetical protein
MSKVRVDTIATLDNSVSVTVTKMATIAGKFLNPATSAPTVRNDGNPLQENDVYYNISNGLDYVRKSGAWVKYDVTTASKLETARNINGVAFDGTANITIADSTRLMGYHVTNTTSFSAGGAEVRELNKLGAQTGVQSEAPRISFHWSGRVASQIALEIGGRMAVLDNPGTGYQDFIAKNITSSGVFSGSYTGTFGGKIAPLSTAFRSYGTYGVYDVAKIGHVWSMGTAYAIPDDGSTFGTLYGLAYKHTTNPTGGTMAGGHQIVVCSNGSANVAFGMTGGVWTSGNIYAGGTVSQASDARLKTNVKTIDGALDKVNNLRGVMFNWIKDGKHDTGMIAQEVQEVIPELITEDVKEDGSSTLGVNYSASVGLLVEAIKELSNKVEAQAKLIAELRGEG